MLFSCQTQDSNTSQLAAASEQKIVAHGKKAADLLMKSLKKELFAAMGSGGLSGAINICKVRAYQITDSLAAVDDLVMDMKRTSYKFRNSDNKPDELDAKILDTYKTQDSAGKSLDKYTIAPFVRDGKTYHRYYQPIKMQQLCLSCHGPTQKMSDEVNTFLASSYPDDKAVGYSAQDFRGLVRVTLNSEALLTK
jgi:hypothetical protein